MSLRLSSEDIVSTFCESQTPCQLLGRKSYNSYTCRVGLSEMPGAENDSIKVSNVTKVGSTRSPGRLVNEIMVDQRLDSRSGGSFTQWLEQSTNHENCSECNTTALNSTGVYLTPGGRPGGVRSSTNSLIQDDHHMLFAGDFTANPAEKETRGYL